MDKQVRNDLIPMKSGIVRLTPLDNNFRPIFSQSYTTPRPFLTTTQVTTTRTSETLPNGNGSDKDFPTDERHGLALTTQTYDPKFHALLSGSEIVETPLPILNDITVTPSDTGTYTFTANEPIASAEDGKIHLEIRDSYGNLLTETTDAVSAGTYKYDADTKTLTFDTSMANVALSCVYYRAATNGEAHQASPILRNKLFMVEIFAEMRSASTEEVVRYFAKMPRATVSGDIPRVTTQKSISAAITYNFQSAPVPEGTSAFYESFTPETAATGD